MGYGSYVPSDIIREADALVVGPGEAAVRTFALSGGAEDLPPKHIIMGRGAKIDLCMVVFPGISADIPVVIDIAGEGAEVLLHCLYLCGGQERLSLRTVVHHRAGHSASRQVFDGMLGGNSHATFDGKIIVAPDSQKVEAYQENHNILLTEAARIDTRPQLEIYADDVKCSHGATVGRLNEDEQFYMRSRGIPEAEAKVLQMISFAAPILHRAPQLASGVEAAIRSLAR